MGLRGVGFVGANNYGMRLTDECEKANDEILLAVQIESILKQSKILTKFSQFLVLMRYSLVIRS